MSPSSAPSYVRRRWRRKPRWLYRALFAVGLYAMAQATLLLTSANVAIFTRPSGAMLSFAVIGFVAILSKLYAVFVLPALVTYEIAMHAGAAIDEDDARLTMRTRRGKRG